MFFNSLIPSIGEAKIKNFGFWKKKFSRKKSKTILFKCIFYFKNVLRSLIGSKFQIKKNNILLE